MRVCAAVLKGLAFTALALILIEPLLTGSRPRRGANAFVILADNSQSLLIRDDQAAGTRGEWVRKLLQKESTWKTRLEQDFDVRGYVFDSHLRAVDGFEGLTFDGTGTALTTSLSALSRRFRGLPLAGVLLVTDGNRTDVGDVDWSGLTTDLSRCASRAAALPRTSVSTRFPSVRPISSRLRSWSGPMSPPSASRARRSSPTSPTSLARSSSDKGSNRSETVNR